MIALSPPPDLAAWLAAGLSAWATTPDGRVVELVPAPCGRFWPVVSGRRVSALPASPGRALGLLRLAGVGVERLGWEPGWTEGEAGAC